MRGVLLTWLILASLPVCAMPDFTPFGTQPGLEYPLRPAENCVNCHRIFGDSEQANYFPHNSWSGSMLANATRDPLFWAALDVANNDIPGVGDFCLRCHTPKGWLEGRVAKTTDGNVIDGTNGCYLEGAVDQPDGANNDFQGVTCHYCHRIDPAAEEPGLPLDNASTLVDDQACDGGGEPCRKGPYDYEGDSGLRPPHAWVKSSFLSSSELCASCHEVSSPRVDGIPAKTYILADGTDTGRPFPVERTYTEWKNSDFFDLVFQNSMELPEPEKLTSGQTCQQCHMRVSTAPDARAANYDSPGRRAGELPVHEFVGGNAWMPRVLASEYGAALQRNDAYERTAQLAEENLRSSASVSISAEPWAGTADILSLSVRVTNRSGHKLPTGYAEGRYMWLSVEITDASGAVVFSSGRYDETEARVVVDSQLRDYDVIHGEWNGSQCTAVEDGKRSFHFALANCVIEDTRIPPQGFRGGENTDIAPVGRSYAELGSGRLAHYDDAPYTIKLPLATELPVTVTATLKYQLATREYVEFLRDQAVKYSTPSENEMCGPADEALSRTRTAGPQDKSRGQYMYDLWEREGKSPPVSMATSSLQLTGK